MFLTSGYAYDCAGDAAARFAGEQQGMTYSRLQNPTVEMLEERIALLKREHVAGEERLKTLDSQLAELKRTQLRIAGAIQVLEELMQEQG